MPYLHVHSHMTDLLLFGHTLHHVLNSLKNSTVFGKWASAPLHELVPRLRICRGFWSCISAMALSDMPSWVLRAEKEQVHPHIGSWPLPLP